MLHDCGHLVSALVYSVKSRWRGAGLNGYAVPRASDRLLSSGCEDFVLEKSYMYSAAKGTRYETTVPVFSGLLLSTNILAMDCFCFM